MAFLDDLVGAGLLSGVRAFKKAQESVLEDVETAVRNQKIKVQQTTPSAIKVEPIVDATFEEDSHGKA